MQMQLYVCANTGMFGTVAYGEDIVSFGDFFFARIVVFEAGIVVF